MTATTLVRPAIDQGLPTTAVDVPAGPVDQALRDWLGAWARRDWDAMTAASQPSWRAGEADPRQYLQGAWGAIDLASYTLPKPDGGMRRAVEVRIPTPGDEQRRILYVDVSVRLRCVVRADGGAYHSSRRAMIRLVREDADGQAAGVGTPMSFWAVNPISALRSAAGSKLHVRQTARV